jgi:hypothetical protein
VRGGGTHHEHARVFHLLRREQVDDEMHT